MAVEKVRYQIDKRLILRTCCLVLLLVQSRAFSPSMVIDAKPVVNSFAYINCSYVTSGTEYITAVVISPGGSDLSSNDSYFVVNDKMEVYPGRHYHNRLSLNYSMSGVMRSPGFRMTVSMNISDLQCGDEGTYQCVYYFSPSNNTRLRDGLRVSVRPHHPTISIDKRKMSYLGEILYLAEGQLEVTCTANLGTRGRGRLDWMLYHHCLPEHVQPGDPRIQPVKAVPLLPEDAPCSERMSQTFLIEATIKDQDLMISCFVHNSDFPNISAAEYCLGTTVDACANSEKLFFLTDKEFRAATIQQEYLADAQYQESVADTMEPFKWSHIPFTLSLGFLLGLVLGIACSNLQQIWKSATKAQTERGKAPST